jgi:hypothetical protein
MVNNSTLLTLGEADTTIALALIFGFMLLALGMRQKMFWVLAGPVWIISGLTIFISYGVVFLLSSVGLGMVLLIMGVMSVADR